MTSYRPRLTIGLPVHNGERYLPQAVDSLLSQTFSDFELVISDNASTDQTERICRGLAVKDRRVHYIRNEENIGAARNFNNLLRLSSSPYFKWAATDDICAPDFLKRCIQVLDGDASVVLAYAKTSYIDENGRPLERMSYKLHSNSTKPHVRFRHLVCVSHDCVAIFGVFRREVLEKTSLLGSYVSSDRVLLAQLALLGRFCEIPETLFFRRIHPSASIIIQPSRHARSGWFDPAKDGRPVFPGWRIFFEYLVTVHRSPLRSNQKARCYPQMIRWLRWNWRRLIQDLVVFARHLSRPDLELYRHRGLGAVDQPVAIGTGSSVETATGARMRAEPPKKGGSN